MNLIQQLVEFYKKEPWHEHRLSDEEAAHTFEVLMRKGRIITCMDGDTLLGYGETWRINFEQLGRIICHTKFDVALEDIERGNIAYIANVHIAPFYRKIGVINYLKNRFFYENGDCEYFIGEALRKKHQPLKVFKRQEFFDKYIQV